MLCHVMSSKSLCCIMLLGLARTNQRNTPPTPFDSFAMSNIHGIGASSQKKDAKLVEQRGGTSATAVQKGDKMDELYRHLQEKSTEPAQGGSGQARITLYKNGFQLGDDGEFFELTNPGNQKMVQDMLDGNMPQELEKKIRATLPPTQKDIGVDFVNKMQEMFVPPKPKFDFNKSAGMSLSSGPAVVGASFAAAKPANISVDESKPTTVVQIVLADKQKLRQKFNLDHTVLDVYQHVQFVSKVNKFDLLAGFPPKSLSDASLTVSAAGLAGSSITQKTA